MSKSRRHFSPEQKAEIVRRHLSGKEPVSDLADEFEVQPTQIHVWVKQVLDQAERAFVKTGGRSADNGKDRQIAALQEKLVKKNEVVAELMEEHVQLKKELGEL
jgi:transposase-like protein